jgi:hypothetical protein
LKDELWIAPPDSPEGAHGTRLRKSPGGPPNSQRMLELADIVLGLKQPELKKNPRGSHHQLLKNEPYLIQNKGSKKVRS